MNKAIDISGIILHTERFILRPWKGSDLEDFFEYASVDGVGQMAGWLPHKSIEESRRILDHFISQKKTFALEYQGKIIGSLGIECYDEENYPELALFKGREIGYVLSRKYWGQGLMPEAVKAVTQYLFEVENLDFIIAGHFEQNRQSARVLHKCGFEYIKTISYETQYHTTETSIESILYNPHNKPHFTKQFVKSISHP